MARHRHTLALDLAEPFKPLFAERLLRRAAHQRTLRKTDFEVAVAAASLSATGRKRVAGMIRDELAETVYHRRLRRRVSYEGLIRLEALKLVRRAIQGLPSVVVTVQVILVYDTAVKHNPKALRTCRRYLHWVQRSVFEGQLTPAQLRRVNCRRKSPEVAIESPHMRWGR